MFYKIGFFVTSCFITFMPVFADLKGAAEKYSRSMYDVALAAILGGFAFGAIYMAMGKAEGKQKIADVAFGTICVAGASIFIAWAKSTLR